MESGKPLERIPQQQTRAGTPWWRLVLRFADRVELSFWIVKFFRFWAVVLPRRAAYAVGLWLALLAFVAWPAMRKTVTENVRRVLGSEASERDIRRVTRSSYRNYLRYLTEFLRFPSTPVDELARLVESSGWEHIEKALAAGKGAIFTVFHFGNWDLAGAMLAFKGYKVSVVVDRFNSPRLDRLVVEQRERLGMRLIPLQGARRVLRALHNNEVVALMVDIPSPGTGIPVQMFGATSYVPAGAATIALKTGAAVLPGWLIRKPDNTFRGGVEPAIEFHPTGDSVADVRALTQAIVDRLCHFVSLHPDQWFLFRELWVENPERAALTNGAK